MRKNTKQQFKILQYISERDKVKLERERNDYKT